MENSLGKIIMDGKVLDLDKIEEKEAENVISKLEDKQKKQKSNITNVLQELTQGASE